MAISTQTEALIEFYNQRIELSQKQISQVSIVEAGYTINTGVGSTPIKVYGPDELIGNYDVPIKNLDNQIIQINDEIKNLQQQILTWGQAASVAGCGSTAGISTVYRDDLKYKTYGFTSPNPYSESQGDLTTLNLGIGTVNFISQVSIGTYRAQIGECFSLLCDEETCSGFAASITNATNQITTKREERDNLLTIVNTLKNNRIEFQLQKYAYTESKNKLNSQISSSQAIINYLNNLSYDEWL
jgi:hypothetical protein